MFGFHGHSCCLQVHGEFWVVSLICKGCKYSHGCIGSIVVGKFSMIRKWDTNLEPQLEAKCARTLCLESMWVRIEHPGDFWSIYCVMCGDKNGLFHQPVHNDQDGRESVQFS